MIEPGRISCGESVAEFVVIGERGGASMAGVEGKVLLDRKSVV